MSRPNKCRKILSNPGVFNFKPVGRKLNEDDVVELTIDEFEAIRLADYEGLYQEKAAEQMDVSRQTFGNIINSAHKKLADFLVNAKSLKISGGSIEMVTDDSNFVCFGCKFLGNKDFKKEDMELCPHCISPYLHNLKAGKITGDMVIPKVMIDVEE